MTNYSESSEDRNPFEDTCSVDSDIASGLTGAAGGLTRKPDVRIAFSGKLIDDRFLIEKRIGSGGAGTVFLATDTKDDTKVAIKVLGRRGTYDEASLRRFNQETRVTRYLRNEHIVRVFEYGIAEDHPFFVMEHLSGGTLQDLLKEGPISEEDVLKILLQVCEAVAYAHSQGVIHRDLKPHNIMFVDSSREKLKLLDFGVSKTTTWDIDHEVLTTDGTLFGTPLYFAPERIDGKDADARSDIYSLGCVVYECLAGVPPHVGISSIETLKLHQIKDIPSLKWIVGTKCSTEFDRIVMKMLKRRPKFRYQKIEELISDLKKHADGAKLETNEVEVNHFVRSASASSKENEHDLSADADIDLFGSDGKTSVGPVKNRDAKPAGFYTSVAELDQLSGRQLERGLTLDGLIVKGSSSGIFMATEEATKKNFAVKFLCKSASTNKEVRHVFNRESRVTRTLHHRYIVRAFDDGIEFDLPYFTMEFLSGGSLADLLKRRAIYQSTDLQIDDTIVIIEQLIDALEFAHKRGVIHRSVHPHNIVFLNGYRNEIRLIDFGSANNEREFDNSLGRPSNVELDFGPLEYISPELSDGSKGDRRSDIYSLGCVAYECLTGSPPSLTSALVPIWQTTGGKDCPAWLEHVVLSCLERDAINRYQTMTEVKYYLQNLKKGAVVAPRKKGVSVAPLREKEELTSAASEAPPPSTLQKGLALTLVTLVLVAALTQLSMHSPLPRDDKPVEKTDISEGLVLYYRPATGAQPGKLYLQTGQSDTYSGTLHKIQVPYNIHLDKSAITSLGVNIGDCWKVTYSGTNNELETGYGVVPLDQKSGNDLRDIDNCIRSMFNTLSGNAPLNNNLPALAKFYMPEWSRNDFEKLRSLWGGYQKTFKQKTTLPPKDYIKIEHYDRSMGVGSVMVNASFWTNFSNYLRFKMRRTGGDWFIENVEVLTVSEGLFD